MICVRVENRSRSKQQWLSPLRQVRNVSREPHHAFAQNPEPKRVAPDCVPTHIRAARASPTASSRTFLTCSISIPSRICNSARALSAITFGRVPPLSTPMLHVVVPKKLSSGHSQRANVLQNVEQLLDRRLARFRIRRMRRASFSRDDTHAQILWCRLPNDCQSARR